MNAPRTVVVSAGTYHLPFNRLSDWIGQWVDNHPDVRVVFQHGPSFPVDGAENHEILPYSELLGLCRTADVVVLQGGAGGVMDMRAIGRIPIVVPRIPIDDEVVDNHQLLFTGEMEHLGIIYRVTTAEALWDRIDEALDGSIPTRADAAEPTPGVAGVARLLDQPPPKLGGSIRFRRQLASAALILRRL